jgi:potassium efflux system protein
MGAIGMLKRSYRTTGFRRHAVVGASMVMLQLAAGFAAWLDADTAQAAAPVAAPAPPTPSASASPLYDVIVDLGRNEATRQQVLATLRGTAAWKALAGALEDPTLAADLQVMEEERDTMTRARYMELVDADTRIRERMQAVSDATTALGQYAQKVENDLEQLEREVARWPERVRLVRDRQAPAELQRRAEQAGPELEGLRERLRVRRDELLVAYDRGVEMRSRLDAVRAAIAERRERISADLRHVEDAPIWEHRSVAFPLGEFAALMRLARLEFAEYIAQHGERLILQFVALAGLLFVALRRPAIAGAPYATMAGLPATTALTGAALAALLLVTVLAPRGPLALYRLIGFAMPLLAGAVASKTFATAIPATAWALVFAVFVNEFRAVAELNPASARVLLALQVFPFTAALIHDWRRGALARFMPRWRPFLLRRLVQVELLALAVVVGAGVLGYLGLARGLSALAISAPGFALTFGATAWALDRALAGLLGTPLLQSLRSVREHGAAVLSALRWVVLLFCWAAGIVAFMVAHSALDDLLRLGRFVTSASVTAGELTITLSAVLSAVLVIAVTWMLTRAVGFVLRYELLPRLNLRTGVPVAISTIASYVLVVTGFVLALAALGIDLTKVTLLAGALGVGVGLGLQGVVSNFVSGLILMLERPINVGDQIDVGGVLGEVKRIGVRSSTIRTVQGAEVIVPNSDLASKQVVNWTLSDRARRYEIDVGVAYGSDPAQVLRLLESAAAELSEVQKVPVPRALFVGFGDSSLDFRLFAWVESVDIGLQAQNNLRMAILRNLDRAGIEIPFPQRGLQIRYVPPATIPDAPTRPAG